MAAARLVPIAELQPSQLYVSRAKLDAVLADWPDHDPASLAPIPVKRYGGRLVATDGHTRALAAHRAGHEEILVVPDADHLDDEAYEICVGWCLEASVCSIVDLDERVVDAAVYATQWLDRCRDMHRTLATRRAASGRES